MSRLMNKQQNFVWNQDVSPDIVWIDIESLGLTSRDPILEIGAVVTDREGNERARVAKTLGYSEKFILPKLSEEHLDSWVFKTHTANGLLHDVRQASRIMTMDLDSGHEFKRFVVEDFMVNWMDVVTRDGHIDGQYPMAGASVHFDRRVLEAQMPRLAGWFHYGNYDVSSILRLGRFAGRAMQDGHKRGIHRALPDIEDEISVHKWAMSELVA